MRNSFSIICFTLFLVLFENGVFSCNVPVYRYALERWDSDLYTLDILYKDSLDENELEAINAVLKHSADSENGFNYIVEVVELSESASSGLPQVRLRNPQLFDEEIITRPLRAEFLESVITSPARIETARRLLDGETAVWIFIPCGDAVKDQAARSTLEKEIERLKEILTLPEDAEVITGDEIMLDSNANLRIDFSILEVQKNDPKEEVFIATLLASEQDLSHFQDEPMTFPIFGRGRSLYALIGEGINQEMIEKAGRFLTSACTCQIKELNPGTDLLMPIHWDSAIQEQMVKDVLVPPPFEALASMVAEENKNSTTTIVASSVMPKESSGISYLSIILGVIVLFIAVDLIYYFITRKQSS